MKWQDLRQSDNVEDARAAGGGGGGMVVGGIGLGTIIIALLASLIFGIDPMSIIGGMSSMDSGGSSQQQVPVGTPASDRDVQFVRSVLGDTEDVWTSVFRKQLNAQYTPPKLVLFDGGVNSACGYAQTAMGPFYCPRDQKVYLDMSFFQNIQATAGANADFARAYAIAHEVGHHIQNVTGIMDKVNAARERSDEVTSNALSVRLELQADCFAGVWGAATAQRGLIDNQDLTVALNTASQIGDDYLQRRAQGRIVPDAFTHGTSDQRVRWFKVGLQSGDIRQCDTINARSL
jgi:predicted metalloprotease